MRNLRIFFVLGSSFYLSAQAAKVAVTTDIPTSHQTMQERIANAIFTKYPNMFHRSCDEGDSDSYRCGELPIGTIQGENEKSLFKITIPAQPFNSSGFKGTFPATDIEIDMSRKQYGGVAIPEKLIGSDDALKTSSYFGRDIYVKLDSGNNKMGGTACIYMPGVKTRISSSKATFTAKKKLFLGLKMKSKITTQISFKEGSFDAIKTCFAFQITPKVDPKTKQLDYKYSMIGQSKPVFIGLKPGKVTVDVDVKGGNFIGSIVNLFAKKTIVKQVKAQLEKRIAKEVDNIYEDDISSGKWFSKYINGSFNVKTVTNLQEHLSRALATKYTPDMSALTGGYESLCNKTGKQVLTALAAQVKAKIISPDQYLRMEHQFEVFCEDLQAISVNSFVKDSDSAKAGCYSRSLRPTTEADPIIKPRLNKIAAQCHFDHRLTIKVEPLFKGLGKCLLEQWKYKYSGSCENEVAGVIKAGLGI